MKGWIGMGRERGGRDDEREFEMGVKYMGSKRSARWWKKLEIGTQSGMPLSILLDFHSFKDLLTFHAARSQLYQYICQSSSRFKDQANSYAFHRYLDA